MTEEERKLALMFAQRLEANAAHSEAQKFTVCNLGTLKNEDARALATILREAAEGWRPIASAPDDGRLIWTLRKGFVEAELRQADGQFWRRERVGPDFWLPCNLPAPPAEEGK